VIFDNQFWI